MSISRFMALVRRRRFAGPVLREAELQSDRFLATELLDAEFAEGDSSYNACMTGSDGCVYFALSTHHPRSDARLYCLDPVNDNPELIADVGDITDESTSYSNEARLRQGKVHVPLFEFKGAIYTASLQAAPPDSRHYSGGCFLNIDIATRNVGVVGRAPEGEGIISMAIDRKRNRLYGLTYPHGLLLLCDLATGTTTNIGGFFSKGEQGYFRKPGASPICRSLAIDPRDGIVYWSDSLGRIRAYDAESGHSYWLPGHPLVRDGIRGSHIWRQILWHPVEQVFYGLLYKNNDLFRFDPINKTVDLIDHIPAAQYRNSRHAYEPPATLAFCLAPDSETLCYLTTGPSMLTRSNRRVRRSVHFVSYHLPTRQYRDFGALRLSDGRYPVYCQSISINDGMVYAICWIELPSGKYDKNWDSIRQARAKGRPVESENHIEGANLVRFVMPH